MGNMNNANTDPVSNNNSFQERLDKLPEDVREAMFSIDTANILKAISEENGLHVDQAGELVDETGALMLGDTKPADFISHIQKRVRVDEKTARNIAETINKEIFRAIRESLKAIHNLDTKKQIKTHTEPPKPIESLDEPVTTKHDVDEEVGGEGDNEGENEKNTPPPTTDPYREPIEDDDL